MTRKKKVHELKRFKVVDTARGMAIFGMVIAHILNWWLTENDFWLYEVFAIYALGFGAVSFLFISGASATLSLKRRTMELKPGDKFFYHLIRKVYFLRALLLLVLAFMYNAVNVLWFQDPSYFWSWNVLQTIAISLFLVWPLIKTSKIVRTVIGLAVLLLNYILLGLLLPHQGEVNVYGITFFILFNPIDQYIILPFFSMFLLGTVLGDLLFHLGQREDPQERREAFKPHLIITTVLGIVLIIIGMFFLPDFTIHASLAAMIYALGWVFIGYSVLMYYEIFEPIKLKKSHRYFYYFNYYSFTIYVGHYLIYFLFYRQLTVITIWIPMILTMFIMSIIIFVIYKKIGAKASIKFALSAISFVLATTKEQRKRLIILSKARNGSKSESPQNNEM